MRDPQRIPLVLSALERAWREHPDYRLGQLLCQLKPFANDPFVVEDDRLVASLGVELTSEEEAFVREEPAKRSAGFAHWIESLHDAPWEDPENIRLRQTS